MKITMKMDTTFLLTKIGCLRDRQNKMIYHHSNRPMTYFCKKTRWFRRHECLSSLLNRFLVCGRKLNSNLRACDSWAPRDNIAAGQPIPRKTFRSAWVTHPILLHPILSLDCVDRGYVFPKVTNKTKKCGSQRWHAHVYLLRGKSTDQPTWISSISIK